jgi:hypothetical protein
MSGQASPDDRIKASYGLLEALDQMDFNTREKISVLTVALAVLWNREMISIELFDSVMAALKKKILNMNEPEKEVVPS